MPAGDSPEATSADRAEPGAQPRSAGAVPGSAALDGEVRTHTPIDASSSATNGDRNPSRAIRHRWSLVGALILVFGVVLSSLGAAGLARNDATLSHRSARATASQVAANLTLTLQRKSDLIASAAVFLIDDPTATNAQFRTWFDAIGGFTSYPEITGLAEVVLVPASRLPAYAASEVAHPSGPLVAKGVFTPIPPGSRLDYCFAKVQLERATVNQPAAVDYCASPTTVLGQDLAIRDSGVSAYRPVEYGGTTLLAIVTPIYRTVAAPSTVAARRASFVGWLGTSSTPTTLLDLAIAGQQRTAVSFRCGTGPSSIVFNAGVMPPAAQSSVVGLHNGWTVTTFSTVSSKAIFSHGNSLELWLFGLALSVLIALLIYVLGTGRSRAVALVSERTDELQFQAMHDSLTGLPNRALIYDRMGLMLARARRNHSRSAVMYLDIDDFKDVNDSLGHAAGDHLLKAVAVRLSTVLREDETVGRLGGDEFVVLLEGEALEAGVDNVADRILDILSAPFILAEAEHGLSVTSSIGVVIGDTATPDEMLRNADIALYRAKAAGKRCAVVFAPLMQEEVARRHQLEVDLQAALDGDQFFLLYQPTIDLKTDLFTGVEALLRWRHPTRGVVQPDDFIPALESSGLIVPVGAWVLEEACRQGALWHSLGHRFSVAVNVSIRQIELPRIVSDVSRALAASGFDPKALILELTESSLMQDVESTIVRLEELHALGLRLAVDDFGTGYSSLSYLKRFPVSVLKIDRSFIAGIASSTESAAIVHALVGLGQTLGLETIAEGVEDRVQRILLERENVDTGQGFLFARPIDAQAIDLLARKWNAKSPVTQAAAVTRG